MSDSDFRNYLPETPRYPSVDARTHTRNRMQRERPQGLFANWRRLFEEPYKGLTVDGTVMPGLFRLQPECAPSKSVIDATNALTTMLSAEQMEAMRFPADSPIWRDWQNTELYVETHGLRLDEYPMPVRQAAMRVVEASLSASGYRKSRDVMKLNGFLGNLVNAPLVLGEWSYLFCLFGEPSPTEPWGWHLFGHHLCLNCLLIGDQMTLTPAFMGAEPAYGDEGVYAGLRLFEDEERDGLALMQSLSAAQQETAIVARSMMGGDLPDGRRHFADNLHLGGAYQDNRVVPYEGLRANDLSERQRRDLLGLIDCYQAYLPDGPRTARMTEIESYLDDTHFCWIGDTKQDSAFYYRIQSPVTFIEFDHHTGVFLTNDQPAKFHVHTIVRTPNGNDYGLDLLRLHRENSAHHHHS